MSKLLLILSFSFSFAFYIGVGGFTVCKNKAFYKKCSYKDRIPIYKITPKNVNSFSIWITRDWKEFWYPAKTINKAIKKGFTPIFIFYYFADEISPEFVKKHKKEYFAKLKKFKNFLKKIKGKKIVIINPEYNENNMASSKQFDKLQVKSIKLLKDKNTLVGICLGDFGDYNKIWDEYNWNLYSPSMKESAKISDFIAFQEMRAITRNNIKEIKNTPLRALAFALYLNKKYKKPTFLAYLAISSYKTNLQSYVLKEFKKLIPIFKNGANLIGFNFFNFIDNPNHTGYFKQAEKYWGVINSNGKRKKSYKIFSTIK